MVLHSNLENNSNIITTDTGKKKKQIKKLIQKRNICIYFKGSIKLSAAGWQD